MPSRKTPLAWKNLTHDRRRLVVALCGVNFAVLLMFMETGFQNALFDSTVKMLRDLKADIIVVSKANYAMLAKQMFDRRRIYQARAVEGVESAHPLYVETFYAVWKRPGEKSSPIRVLAFDLDNPVLDVRPVHGSPHDLRAPGTAMIDAKSKDKYGIPASAKEIEQEADAELTGRSVRLVGTFDMGTDFANDGNLIMSAANFAAYFPGRVPGGDPLSIVDLGIVRVEPGADVEEVARRLRKQLPRDVAVYTKQGLIQQEMRFWSNSTPVGYIFALGTIMGFVVGVIICYQIIHADVSDHMPEFATLRAMGYSPAYFVVLVLRQAIYLSLVGFIPGLVISFIIFHVLAYTTGLLMILNFPRALFVLALTMAMCMLSGCLAVRKVLSADPADLF